MNCILSHFMGKGGADRVYCQMTHILPLKLQRFGHCLFGFAYLIFMFYINFQKFDSSATRSEWSRMFTFWCAQGWCVWVPCIKEHMMKATKDVIPLKQWVTSNRGAACECYLVPREHHCIFSSLNKDCPWIEAALRGKKFIKHPSTYLSK